MSFFFKISNQINYLYICKNTCEPVDRIFSSPILRRRIYAWTYIYIYDRVSHAVKKKHMIVPLSWDFSTTSKGISPSMNLFFHWTSDLSFWCVVNMREPDFAPKQVHPHTWEPLHLHLPAWIHLVVIKLNFSYLPLIDDSFFFQRIPLDKERRGEEEMQTSVEIWRQLFFILKIEVVGCLKSHLSFFQSLH